MVFEAFPAEGLMLSKKFKLTMVNLNKHMPIDTGKGYHYVLWAQVSEEDDKLKRVRITDRQSFPEGKDEIVIELELPPMYRLWV